MGLNYRLRGVRLEPDGPTQDLSLVEGRLEELHPNAEGMEIEGAGALLLPGMIDPHVHLRSPGMEAAEDWESGARAAARGGVTTVLDMPNNRPPITSGETLAAKRALAQVSRVNWGLYLGATASNTEEIGAAANIAAVKVFLGSSTGNLLLDDDESLERTMRAAAAAGLPVCLHAEDEGVIRRCAAALRDRTEPTIHGQVRPPEAAAAAVRRALAIGERAGATLYFCHVSTAAELALLREAKRAGRKVFVEATPQHLTLTEQDLETLGNFGKVNPPLRSASDQAALWEAVQDGTVDTIGTDHAPHPRAAKLRGYWEAPSGMPGLETALPLLLTAMLDGRLSFERLRQLTEKHAAAIFGITQTGNWALADLDTARALQPETLATRCGWSPFAGKVLRGWPTRVWVNGSLVFDQGRFCPPGSGQEITFRH